MLQKQILLSEQEPINLEGDPTDNVIATIQEKYKTVYTVIMDQCFFL